MFKKIKDSEPRPRWYGLVRPDPPKHTITYCPIPFNIAFRVGWIIWCFVCEPFPSYKRKLNVAISTAYERGAESVKREETIRLIGYYIKEQGLRLESRRIGNTRFVNSVLAFVVKLIKESEPKIYDELYTTKVPSKSTDK